MDSFQVAFSLAAYTTISRRTNCGIPEGDFMDATRYLALTLIAVSVCAASSAAEEHEKKIQRSDLPPAVETTVASQSQGATIRGFNEEQ
jgi:hypothetical protein